MKAAEFSHGNIPADGLLTAGLGKMINVLSGQYMSNHQEIYDLLVKQIQDKKHLTWRERTDKEMGL